MLHELLVPFILESGSFIKYSTSEKGEKNEKAKMIIALLRSKRLKVVKLESVYKSEYIGLHEINVVDLNSWL